MKALLDSSVLVAALLEDQPGHDACLRLLAGKPSVWSHALSETYATLTGGRLGLRLGADVAAELIGDHLAPRLSTIELTTNDLLKTLKQAHSAGVRGGAIYDYLHLMAARKAKADVLYTLNARHFAALARSDDPDIRSPA